MPLYVGDYLKDTMHLTPEQHGIYDLLLMNYWTRREALPDDDEYLARVSKTSLQTWHSHRSVISKFFTVADGKWTQKRSEKELAKALKQLEAKSRGGKMGAIARWNSKTMGEPMGKPMPSQWQNDAHQRQRQHQRQLDIDNKVDGKSSYSFRALKVSNLIIANLTAWHYDNCKVQLADLSPRSLASVIEPFLEKISDDKTFFKAWHEAVRIAHSASVDGLARNPTAYAIQCFKEQLINIKQ